MKALFDLFCAFLQIGFFSIGGGYATIPLIQRYVVEAKGWLDFRQFTDMITISQMTPGPIAVNTSTFVGLRIAGLPGAAVATAGCVISGILISVFLYRFFEKYQNTNGVKSVLGGLRAASTGLIASAACTILLIALCGTAQLSGTETQWNLYAAAICGAALFLLRKFKMGPMTVMLLSGVAGLFCYYLLPML